MVDHDAPAGKSGLKVHDVILQLDGQPFDNVDQLRRRLLEMPVGAHSYFAHQPRRHPHECDRAAL